MKESRSSRIPTARKRQTSGSLTLECFKRFNNTLWTQNTFRRNLETSEVQYHFIKQYLIRILLKLSSKKMELYHLRVTVVLVLMIATISNAKLCTMSHGEDNKCEFYNATSDGEETCYIHITDQDSFFGLRKSKTLTEAILDFIEIVNPPTSRRPENKRENISDNIEENWTRVQANRSREGQSTYYVIRTKEFTAPNHFRRFKTYIWVKGSLHYTNDTNCFPETTTQSTDTQYMTTTQSTSSHYPNTTQSTGSHYMNTTTQSTTSDYHQSTPTTDSVTTAGPSDQWWLYVIIGVLIMIVALLAATVAFQKRRKTDADDAMTLRHEDENLSMSNGVSLGPRIPNFYETTGGGFQTASNPEEHIYEEPDLYGVRHTYEDANDNGGPVVTCGTENSGSHPPSPERGPRTRRGSDHDSENSIYGCIPAGDFQS